MTQASSELRLTALAESFGKPGAAIDSLADIVASAWQLGYVTTDIDRAVATMAEAGFRCTDVMASTGTPAVFLVGDTPADIELRSAFGVRGSMFIELIEPVAGAHEVYSSFLPTDGSYALRLHHLATLIPTGDEEWDRVRAILARTGLGYDWSFVFPGTPTRVAYVDTRAQLGHFVEICQLDPDGLAFFSAFAASDQ